MIVVQFNNRVVGGKRAMLQGAALLGGLGAVGYCASLYFFPEDALSKNRAFTDSTGLRFSYVENAANFFKVG